MIPEEEEGNYETFRDCLSDALIQDLTVTKPKQRKRAKSGKNAKKGPIENDDGVNAKASEISVSPEQNSNDAEELGDFIEYLASDIFPSLPPDLRTLSYSAIQNHPSLTISYTTPLPHQTLETILATLPPSVTDSLTTYLSKTPSTFLPTPLENYITSTTAPPPIWVSTRADACEMCERPHLPLTYHHLIPRAVHAKALKRGWAEEWELNKVAWLCRACHSYVHRVCSHEELARDFDSVEKLLEREDVRDFVKWVGRVRWKAR